VLQPLRQTRVLRKRLRVQRRRAREDEPRLGRVAALQGVVGERDDCTQACGRRFEAADHVAQPGRVAARDRLAQTLLCGARVDVVVGASHAGELGQQIDRPRACADECAEAPRLTNERRGVAIEHALQFARRPLRLSIRGGLDGGGQRLVGAGRRIDHVGHADLLAAVSALGESRQARQKEVQQENR